MQSADDIASFKIKLLSSIALDEVSACVAEIIDAVCAPKAIAILMWDTDLEAFGERFQLGPRKKEIAKLAEAFGEEGNGQFDKKIYEVDLDDLGVSVAKELDPVICVPIQYDGTPCACILIAGADDAEEAEILEGLESYPIGAAFNHAWEYRELQLENDRLRSQYEEMENRTRMLEDQTMKLIHDLTARDTLRTRQVDRERLVYWISNAVRSSVHIQEVLETTVEKIGTTLSVSRCLLLRVVVGADQIVVFEWTQSSAPPVKNLFFSESGLEFTRAALSKTSPHDLVNTELDTQSTYNKEFLRRLDIKSGLIVPLVLRDQVLGVLFLQDCVQPRDWSIDDVSMIGSLADNLSVAIENADLHLERERQAVTDGLTGVANRRSFNDTFVREFERAKRYNEPLSLVVIDLDFLKKINDTYGHQAGDEAIKTIGHLLKQSSRSVDLPARYGGEEFCLLLPNTEIEMAEQLAERLRRLINEAEIEGPGRISASLGVATYPMHADEMDTLFHRADEALYAAKQGGRNQVKVAAALAEGAAASPRDIRIEIVGDPTGMDGAGKESSVIDVK